MSFKCRKPKKSAKASAAKNSGLELFINSGLKDEGGEIVEVRPYVSIGLNIGDVVCYHADLPRRDPDHAERIKETVKAIQDALVSPATEDVDSKLMRIDGMKNMQQNMQWIKVQ
jgi:hypothetical protein